MTTLDSVKLFSPYPIAAINSRYRDRLRPIFPKILGARSKQFAIREEFLKPGISRISDAGNGLIIELSAKVLGHQYHELLSQSTFPTALGALSEYLNFDPSAFMRNAQVLLCHPCVNLLVSSVSRHLLNLSTVTNPNFETILYSAGEKISFIELAHSRKRLVESVTFQKIRRTIPAKERLLIYDKTPEMAAKRNTDPFYMNLKNFDEQSAFFKNHLRVEMPLGKFSKIRKSFRLTEKGSPSLLAILNSKANPLFDLLFQIILTTPPPFIESDSPSLSLGKRVQLGGIDLIIEKFLCEMPLLKLFLKQKTTCPYPKFKQYRPRAEALRRSKLSIGYEENLQLIAELKNVFLNRAVPDGNLEVN